MTELEFLAAVQRCRGPIKAVIQRIVGAGATEAVIEDIVAGAVSSTWAYIKLHRKKLKRKPIRNVAGLVYTAARLDALNYVATHVPTVSLDAVDPVYGDESPVVLPPALCVRPEPTDIKVDVQRALSRLDAESQVLIWNIHVVGKTVMEVAREEHRFPMQVWRLLRKAEKLLRRWLWAYASPR